MDWISMRAKLLIRFPERVAYSPRMSTRTIWQICLFCPAQIKRLPLDLEFAVGSKHPAAFSPQANPSEFQYPCILPTFQCEQYLHEGAGQRGDQGSQAQLRDGWYIFLS